MPVICLSLKMRLCLACPGTSAANDSTGHARTKKKAELRGQDTPSLRFENRREDNTYVATFSGNKTVRRSIIAQVSKM